MMSRRSFLEAAVWLAAAGSLAGCSSDETAGFAVIYRPDTQLACEDLARAVSFIFEHADDRVPRRHA